MGDSEGIGGDTVGRTRPVSRRRILVGCKRRSVRKTAVDVGVGRVSGGEVADAAAAMHADAIR